jgi:hypothetical protein
MPYDKEPATYDLKYLKRVANRNKVKGQRKERKRQHPPGPISLTGNVGLGRKDGIILRRGKNKLHF